MNFSISIGSSGGDNSKNTDSYNEETSTVRMLPLKTEKKSQLLSESDSSSFLCGPNSSIDDEMTFSISSGSW